MIAYHVAHMTCEDILVRCSDTDVLVLLLQLASCVEKHTLVMDFGSGDTRRYIDVLEISRAYSFIHPKFPTALLGLHALTGCDYTSSFYRKGKAKPLQRLENGPSRHIMALASLSSDHPDIDGVVAFVCKSLYGCSGNDINVARHDHFVKKSSGSSGNSHAFSRLKRINCASLPPCWKVLKCHLARSSYVARLWRRCDQAIPADRNATDYGWVEVDEECLRPLWFEGSALPAFLAAEPLDESNQTPGEVLEEATDASDIMSEAEWEEDSDNDSDYE